MQSLYEAITSSGPDLLVPCDDVVVWQMHELCRTRAEIRPLIERSLGAATAYEIVSSRGKFMKIVEELRLRAPKTKEIAERGRSERLVFETECKRSAEAGLDERREGRTDCALSERG